MLMYIQKIFINSNIFSRLSLALFTLPILTPLEASIVALQPSLIGYNLFYSKINRPFEDINNNQSLKGMEIYSMFAMNYNIYAIIPLGSLLMFLVFFLVSIIKRVRK